MGLIIRLHTLNTTKKESVAMLKISCRKEVIIVSQEKNPTLLKSSLKRREVKHGQAFSSPWLLLEKPVPPSTFPVKQSHSV